MLVASLRGICVDAGEKERKRDEREEYEIEHAAQELTLSCRIPCRTRRHGRRVRRNERYTPPPTLIHRTLMFLQRPFVREETIALLANPLASFPMLINFMSQLIVSSREFLRTRRERAREPCTFPCVGLEVSR